MWKKLFQNEVTKIALGEKKKNLPKYLLMLFLNILSAASEGASFAFLFFALNAFSSAETTYLQSFSFFADLSVKQTFTICVLIAIAFQITRSLIFYLSNFVFTRMASKIQMQLQEKIYDQILHLSYPTINRYNVGELLNCAAIPANVVYPLFDNLSKGLAASFLSVMILVIMFKMHFLLSLYTFIVSGTFIIGQKILIKKMYKEADHLAQHVSDINQQSSQIIQGIKIIHAFFKQDLIVKKARLKIRDMNNTTNKLYWLNSSVIPIGEIITVLLVGIILLLGLILIDVEESMVISYLMTFLILTHRLSVRVQAVMTSLSLIGPQIGFLKKVQQFLQSKDKEYLPKSGKTLTGFEEKLNCNNISFRYPQSSSNTLSNISFQIPKGAFIGIVGLSGAGKTTLLDILLRLYEPSSGEILIDGEKADSFSLSSWRKLFGVITQDPFLFNESILSNIQFGENQPMDKVIRAAKLAGADLFIEKMPEKYQTVIGERGFRLSGGERQRIALARVLLKDPEIVILDEATSSLDSKSESIIQKSLLSFKNNKTVIAVAHRLSTISDADCIYFLKNGQIKEHGTHEQLLSLEGEYASLWDLQSKATEKVGV